VNDQVFRIQESEYRMNYADLTTEAEMQDAKQWLAEMLAAALRRRIPRWRAAPPWCRV
jgi:hypothetical protein